MKRNEEILDKLKKIFIKNEKEEKKDDNSLKKIKRAILSVIIAIVVWFVIINIVNPSIAVWRKVTDIDFIGESELLNNGLVVVSKEDIPDLSVKIRGTRNDLMNDMNRISAEINLTNVRSPGVVKVYPSIDMPSNISLEKQRNSLIELEIEYAYTKEIPVRILHVNEDKLDNKIIKSEAEIETVRITGSKNDVEKAESCVVNVDVLGLTGSGYGMYSCEIVDENGSPVDKKSVIYMEHSNVQIKNTVYNKKQTVVKAVAGEDIKEKYIVEIDEETYSKTKIEIGVPPGVSTPSFVEAVFDSEEQTNGVVKFKIQVPEGMYVKDEYITAEIKLKEREEITQTLAVEVINIPDGLVADNPHVVQTMTLSVPKGYEKNIKATVDASDCEAGSYMLSVEFDNEHIKVVGENKVSVTLRNK